MATQSQINNINMSRVLRRIWLNRGVSRADICRDLDLNKSTVTKNVQILLDEGIVEEIREGEASSKGGRKPLALGVRQDFIYVLGLELRPDAWFASLANARGQAVYSGSGRYIRPGTPVELFSQAMESLESVVSDYRISGIAAGLSGVVDPSRGILRHSIALGADKPLALGREASVVAGLPVLLENDANCCCWGDLAGQGDKREGNSLFLLSEIREGRRAPELSPADAGLEGLAVGLGFILNGKVHYGKSWSAGEFTSISTDDARGGQFADDSDPVTLMEELSRHIAFLVNTLNLGRVVVGGVLCERKEELLGILNQTIAVSWPYEGKVDCNIEFSDKGEFAVAQGAAGYYLERLFGLPDVNEESAEAGWDFLKDHLG